MREDLEEFKQRISLLEYLQRRNWTGCRVGTREEFIQALADLVERAAQSPHAATSGEGRICPAGFARCGYSEGTA